jgi:large subunit ribosomal protein L24
MTNARIKRDDLVVVITGKDKGTTGRVQRFSHSGERVVVEGVNKIKRHQSPQKFKEGGIVEREAPIHISNVMLVDPETQKPTRVSAKVEDGKKVRVAKSGAKID